MNSTDGRGPSGLVLGLFRLQLRLYPVAFRARFGSGMEQTFIARVAEVEASGRSKTWFYARTAADMVVSGVRERLWPSQVAFPYEKRGMGMGGFVDVLRQDVRFALRSLSRRPAFALVAILTLALGIGANTAMFTVVNGVLLRPLPYPDSNQLVSVWARDLDDPESRGSMSAPDIADLAKGRTFESLVGYSATSLTLRLGQAERIEGARLSDGLLSVFGYAPVLGRDIQPEEADPSAPRVVVVSHGFWQSRLGGRRDVLGQTLELSGYPHEIVGVAPAGFSFPTGAELWIPSRLSLEGCGRGCHTLMAIGRLAEEADRVSAQAEASGIARALAETYPDSNHGKGFLVLSLQDQIVGDVRAGLWILLGAVGLVLLIACANVANLLLVRAAGRLEEVAVRSALGASRRRLAVQVLLESFVLAVAGGLAGLALAQGGLGLLRRVEAGTIPRIEQISIDVTVLLFTLGVVGLVTLLFGLSPALRLSRVSLQATVQSGRRTGAGQSRFRGLLVGAQVALTLIVLVGAGLLMRSFTQLYAVELGYQTRQILRFSLSVPESRYETLEEVAGFFEQVEERIRSLPGVAEVGSVYGAPLGTGNVVGELILNDDPEAAPGEEHYAALRPITPGYLDAMGIPVLRGRGIEPSDRHDAPPVALVNQALVRENFRDGEPIGQRVRVTIDFGYGSPSFTIVGVLPDIRAGITEEPVPEVYIPQRQFGPGSLTTTVRSLPGAGSLIGPIRSAVAAVDPGIPVYRVETMEEAVRREVAPTRFYLVLAGLFSLLALTLAAVGVYGVVAFLVSQRTREIGIRIALGASGGDVLGLVVRQGLAPATLGVIAGLLGALAATRVLDAVLFGVAPHDPVTMALVAALVLATSVVAIVIPARRATRVDPVRALKQE